MKYKEENIGEIFKEAFDDYSPKPDSKVWDNVLKESKPKSLLNNSFFKGFAAAFISGVIILAAIVLFNNNDKKHKEADSIKKQTETTVLDSPHKEKSTTKVSEKEKEIVKNNANKELIENTKEKKINKESQINSNKEELKVVNEVAENNSFAKTNDSKTNETVNTNVSKSEVDKNLITKIENKNIEPEPQHIDVNHTETKEPQKSSFDSSNIEFSKDQTICFGEDAELSVSEGYKYKWNTGAISNKIIVSPVSNSIYSVTVTDDNGNSIKHDFNVYIDKSCTAVLVPNAFSPDNDGINDKLEVYGKGITNYSIKIVSRNGKTVFASNDINYFWDGTDNGRELSAGVYVYQIVYTDAKGNKQIKQGTVSIIK